MTAAALTLMIIVISLGLDQWFPALPWYTTFVVAFTAGLFAGSLKARAFLSGFLGVALFWALLLTIAHIRNDGILTERIGALLSEQMPFHAGPVFLLIATPLLGGLLGGLSALSGKLFSSPDEVSILARRRRKRRSGSYRLKL